MRMSGRGALHAAPIGGGGVAGADGGHHFGQLTQLVSGSRVVNAGERGAEIALNVMGQRLHRGHIEDPAPLGCFRRGLGEQLVDGVEEGCQRLAGAGGSVDQGVVAAGDGRPPLGLGRGGGSERRLEPGGGRGGEQVVKRHGCRVVEGYDKGSAGVSQAVDTFIHDGKRGLLCMTWTHCRRGTGSRCRGTNMRLSGPMFAASTSTERWSSAQHPPSCTSG